MKKLFELKKGELLLNVWKMENLGIKLEVKYDGKQADAGFFVDLEGEEYAEMLKALIPGKVDDVIIDAIKAGI